MVLRPCNERLHDDGDDESSNGKQELQEFLGRKEIREKPKRERAVQKPTMHEIINLQKQNTVLMREQQEENKNFVRMIFEEQRKMDVEEREKDRRFFLELDVSSQAITVQ